ncbi:MAG TPA: hypothetical protein VI112_04670, partial [Bacteroidia bacterium]
MKRKNLIRTLAIAGTLLTFSQESSAQFTTTSPGGTSPQYNQGFVGLNIPSGNSAAQQLHVVGKTRFDLGTVNGAGNGRMFLTRTSNINQECLISFGTGPFATATNTYDWAMGTYASGTANNDWIMAGWTPGRIFTVLQSNGNVGIGGSTTTGTNPLAKLSVNGDLLVSNSGTTGAVYLYHGSTQYSTASAPEIGWYNSGGLGLFHPSANIIAFSIASAEAMRIGNGTNPYVGISNTNPQYPLDVTGNIHTSANVLVNGKIGVGLLSPNALIDMNTTTGGLGFQLNVQNGVTWGYASKIYTDNSLTKAFSIANSNTVANPSQYDNFVVLTNGATAINYTD